MVRHTIRGLFQLVGVLTAGLLIMIAIAGWRLSAGPISLSYLTPYFEDALNGGDAPFDVRFDDTILAWSSERSILEIRVRGVRAIAREGGMIAEIPEMSVSLSGRALFRGEITPRRMAVFGPQLIVTRRADGSFEFGGDAQAGSGGFASRIVEEMVAPEGERRAFRDLNQFSIVDGDLTIDDRRLDTTWRAPVADITLTRSAHELTFEATVDVQAKAQYATVTIDGQYAIDGSDLHFDAEFVNVNPRLFAELSPRLKMLEMLNAPLTGSISVATGAGNQIDAVEFNLTAAAGAAAVVTPIAAEVKFLSATAKGRYDAISEVVELADLTVELGDKGEIAVPAPIDHVFPVRTITASATYDSRTGIAEVPRLTFDLGGPTAAFSFAVRYSGDAVEIAANGLAERVPVTGVERYWPPKLGDLAHEWVVKHMAGGSVPEAKIKFGANWNRDKGFALTELNGTMKVRDTTIDYLAPMPKALGVNADATFDLETFSFDISRGAADGIAVTGGKVLFTGLDQVDQYCTIELRAEGPFDKALALIDHEPLKFAAAVGIEPGAAQGRAAVELKIHFLSERDMTIERVKIAADAELYEIHVPKLVLGLDLSFGRMSLKADNQGMDVTGTAWLGTMAIDLGWRENFVVTGGPARVYRVSTRIDDTQRTVEIGFDKPPFTREFMTGPADATFDIVYDRGGNGRLDAEFVLNEMALALPEFDWSKPAGAQGKANVRLTLDGARMTGIDKLSVEAGDLVVDATARFDDGGRLQSMNFARLAFGRSDLTGDVARADPAWRVRVAGTSVDLINWLDEDATEPGEKEELPPLTIAAKLDRVLIAPDRQLNDFEGTLSFDGKLWQAMDVDAAVGDGKRVRILLTSAGGTRKLEVSSEDAGATLRALDFFDDLVGGTLKLTGTFDDTMPGSPLTGRALIDKYRIVNAPALAHLLSIAALTGILEALTGDGLAFDVLEARFIYDKGLARFEDGRASGPSLGVTGSGVLDTDNAAVDITGTIVPAYALNSAFGKLPVIGDIFTGGEKGGGVFAANYSLRGPVAEPKVTVNPLSILTPGFLRNIFGIIPGAEPPTREDAPAPPPSTN